VTLPQLPRVDRLTLATVTTVPPEHPEYATFEPFPVHAWVIRHPRATVLFDTGIGLGHAEINQWYAPQLVSLADGLASIGLEVTDIDAVVLSHLHFDHCGQQGALDAPTYLQAVERELAGQPGYTVDEWADVPIDRQRLLHGDEELFDGVLLMATPGHTHGHQSVVVEGGGQRVVLGAQCAYGAAEIESGVPSAANLDEPASRDVAQASLERIRSLRPTVVHLSHDAEVVTIG
jgi:glyoxylase-like metal-dependent hydrolase (beta-lactamase superfamily II)